MTTTCACRMQSYVCKELKEDNIYLSPMHITQRAIIGYDVPDADPRQVNLDMMQRVLVHNKMQGEISTKNILQAMKKIQGDECILAAQQFG